MVNVCTETQKRTCTMKLCNFVCWTLRWRGNKGHISHDSNKPNNNTVGNTIMPRLMSDQQKCHWDISSRGNSTSCGKALWHLQTDDLCFMDNTIQSVNDRPRSYIQVHHLQNWTTIAKATATQIPGLCRISDQTVHTQLRKASIFPKRPEQRNILTPHSRASIVVPNGMKWTRARRTVLRWVSLFPATCEWTHMRQVHGRHQILRWYSAAPRHSAHEHQQWNVLA